MGKFVRIHENDDWIVDYDKDKNMYRVSYFEDNHFVDECWFDAYKEKEVKENKIMTEQKIRIKYFDDEIEKLTYIGGDSKSNWVDLRSAKTMCLTTGEFALIPLGVAMQLPDGYEGHVVPRSSTFKNYGVLQSNSMGVIDSSYCGDGDQWFFPVYATRDVIINKNDRIAQFRIEKVQPRLVFEEVEILGNEDRGGHGSTGVN